LFIALNIQKYKSSNEQKKTESKLTYPIALLLSTAKKNMIIQKNGKRGTDLFDHSSAR